MLCFCQPNRIFTYRAVLDLSKTKRKNFWWILLKYQESKCKLEYLHAYILLSPKMWGKTRPVMAVAIINLYFHFFPKGLPHILVEKKQQLLLYFTLNSHSNDTKQKCFVGRIFLIVKEKGIHSGILFSFFSLTPCCVILSRKFAKQQ